MGCIKTGGVGSLSCAVMRRRTGEQCDGWLREWARYPKEAAFMMIATCINPIH